MNRRINSKTKYWQSKFMPVLIKHHKNHAKKTFHRLMKKSSTLKTSLKRRSREYEVEFDLTLEQVRNILLDNYGKKCRYCKVEMTIKNLVCDHKKSISSGGPSITSNLQIICARCNTRKGPLSHEEYSKFVKWINKQTEDMKSYICRKLSMADIS